MGLRAQCNDAFGIRASGLNGPLGSTAIPALDTQNILKQ